jgi:hypothetical protein
LYVQYNMPGQLAQGTILTQGTTNSGPDSPMATAEKFAALNKAGNVNITLLDQDVTFGFTDAQGKYTSPYLLGFPNTIQVVVRRDDVANGPLNLFFAKVLGIASLNITATARATIYSGAVSSLQSLPGVSAHVLPVALDYKIWDNFYKTNQSPDGLIHLNPSNNTPQLQVYPYPGNAPGSFGLVDTGPPAQNIPAFKNWIDNGQTPNDISYLLSHNMLPVSMNAPQQWKVGPGFKDSMQSDFASQQGLPNLIPLFKAVHYPDLLDPTYTAALNQGQGATYAIVGFIGVTVSQVSANGLPLVVDIQPMAVVDPNAVIQTLSPAGTQVFPLTPSVLTNTTITTFGSAKLTN